MGYAVLFPGQGSQHVGMGEELFALRPDLLGEAADAVLGWSLRDTCLHGPDEVLTRTDRAQPALFALSYVLWEEIRSAMPRAPLAAAGHSLGEYTALAAAGVFDYFTGLRLVARRGEAMARAAAAADPSGMAALLGTDEETAERVAADRRSAGGRLWIANLNAPGQIVVAGGADDIAWVVENARELGVRRAVPLNVAGAFHSPLMEPAVADLRVALDEVEFAPAAFPVYANVSATPADDVGASLAAQVTAPVRFTASLEAMAAAGAGAFVHVGPGDVTAGMAKRAVPGAAVAVVSEPGHRAAAAVAIEEYLQ